MPIAAKRPCAGGCGRLVGRGFCQGCWDKGKGRDRRPSAAKRLYGHRWAKASKAYLQKHPLCADPDGRHPGVARAATCVDHIEPHRGDPALFWDSSNWQPLCNSCHSYKTATQDGGFGH